jgi:hypothetical protein
MFPVNVPAARPVTCAVTVNVAGVVPVAGETVSQAAPLTLAVKLALGLAVTDRLCEAGDVPPAVAVNESVPGLTFNVDVAELTVKVTGTVRVIPLPVITMFPVNVPAARPVTCAVTVNVAGVVPEEGDTLSQAAPLTRAVKLVFGDALTEMVFDAGDEPPALAVNVNEVGLTVSVLVAAETVNVTGTR